MKLTVIGAGYVGLITAISFAEKGFVVTCVDTDQEKVSILKNHTPPFYEPELESALRSVKIHFTTELFEAISSTEMIFLAVGTPPTPSGEADMTAVEDVLSSLSDLNCDAPIVIRSTLPPGSNTRLSKMYIGLSLISSPEFLQQGRAFISCRNPNRVIYGSNDQTYLGLFIKIYSSFDLKPEKILLMSPESAELSKYAANIFLASRVSLINEFSRLCDQTGADISDIKNVLSLDPRIGPQFLNAGLGYGGSCLPKDVEALSAYSISNHEPVTLIPSIRDANNLQFERFLLKISSSGISSFAIWGLSFKPDTDDLRESPGLKLAHRLADIGMNLYLYDPVSYNKLAQKFESKYTSQVCESAQAAVQNADALIICTEWEEFINYDLKKLKSQMKNPVIFDGRNIYDPKKMKELGFEYHSIGRPS